MKSLLAAVAFLTRIPVARVAVIDATDVARSAGWFPLVGLLLGTLYSLAAVLLKGHLPSGVIAVLLVLLDALATGALHYDGLADTADGFGGGESFEDVLRIMRDHAVGSYGAIALAILVALKVSTYTAMLDRVNWMPAIVLTPAIGRWSMLLLTAALPYARTSASVITSMGRRSLVEGTLLLGVGLVVSQSGRAGIATGVAVATTGVFGLYCKRRAGGITGDTLGANLQIAESAAMLAFLWW